MLRGDGKGPTPDMHSPLRKSAAPEVHSVAGLFAGIGGFERGLARAGHETALLCENDPLATAVLEARFPDIARHSDVRSLEELPRATTLVVAGFPCQDLSQAGTTVGITGSRSGLVGEVLVSPGFSPL